MFSFLTSLVAFAAFIVLIALAHTNMTVRVLLIAFVLIIIYGGYRFWKFVSRDY